MSETTQAELLKANLNLYAVLKNLEDLTAHEPSARSFVRDLSMSIQFKVKGGPRAFVAFGGGRCVVGQGLHPQPNMVLGFTSPRHLNRMFEGSAVPIPLRGMHRLGFLAREFTWLTDRLEHYLRPNDELLGEGSYLALNTRFSLTTAMFALPELCALDPVGRHLHHHIGDGEVEVGVLPDGPRLTATFRDGDVQVQKGKAHAPRAVMEFVDMKTANELILGKADTFSVVARGGVQTRGVLPMLDAMSIIWDRLPIYLN